MKSWIEEQHRRALGGWISALEEHHPQEDFSWKDAEAHLKRVREASFLEVTEDAGASVLFEEIAGSGFDLACGIGWLSAFLSSKEKVAHIDSVEADEGVLEILPQVVELMKGDADKIDRINGVFYPICADDGSYDFGVCSSAVHHSDDLEALFVECGRVIRKGGRFLVLNERPISKFQFLKSTVKGGAEVLRALFSDRFAKTDYVMSPEFIYIDRNLGDRVYTEAFYRHCFAAGGFECVRTVQTGTAGEPGVIDYTHFELVKNG